MKVQVMLIMKKEQPVWKPKHKLKADVVVAVAVAVKAVVPVVVLVQVVLAVVSVVVHLVLLAVVPDGPLRALPFAATAGGEAEGGEQGQAHPGASGGHRAVPWAGAAATTGAGGGGKGSADQPPPNARNTWAERCSAWVRAPDRAERVPR